MSSPATPIIRERFDCPVPRCMWGPYTTVGSACNHMRGHHNIPLPPTVGPTKPAYQSWWQQCAEVFRQHVGANVDVSFFNPATRQQSLRMTRNEKAAEEKKKRKKKEEKKKGMGPLRTYRPLLPKLAAAPAVDSAPQHFDNIFAGTVSTGGMVSAQEGVPCDDKTFAWPSGPVNTNDNVGSGQYPARLTPWVAPVSSIGGFRPLEPWKR